MSVQVKESEAKGSQQPTASVADSDIIESSHFDSGFSQTPGFSKQGKFSPTLTPSNILKLQRSIGNQAVQRLITREKTNKSAPIIARLSDEHHCGPACNHVQRHMGHDHEEDEAH